MEAKCLVRWSTVAAMAALAMLEFTAPLGAQAQRQRRGGPNQAARQAATASEADDMNTTIPLALKNVSTDQLVKFIADMTGKPVIKQKAVQSQITITSPAPVTKRQALDLIYDSLKMDNIYVIELEDQIRIVNADAIKGLPIESIDDSVDLQAMPDSLGIAQKIYHLRNISASDLKKHIEKIVPESAMTIDDANNTVILTDQISRLKRYDRVISMLDDQDIDQRSVEIFKLTHANAIELATLLGNVLTQSDAEQQPTNNRGQMRLASNYYSSRSRRYSSREAGASEPITAGDVTFVPDPRMNWLIVASPANQMDEIKRLINEFDKEEELDVRARDIPLKHIEASDVAGVVSELFRETRSGTAKDVIRVMPSDEGGRLIVMSSLANFQRIEELVGRLDNENAERREARTYEIEHLQVTDLADQLQDLFDQSASDSYNNNYPGRFFFFGSQNNSKTRASFMPSPRTSSLMVLARPKDFEFIEQMIEELDVPIDPKSIEPRIYRIRHTDANEMVKVLETIFEESTAGRSDFNDFFYRSTSSSRSSNDPFQELLGEARFVVDNVTNTIVAIASNYRNYEVIDGLIEKLDKVDPESTEIMVRELEHADAMDLAEQMNNLFSEGAVQQRGQQNQGGNNQGDDGENSAQQVADAVRQIAFPWQSGQQNNRGGQQEERPINTMVGNVRVVPDLRSNAIMVAAPPIYFSAISDLIDGLDRPEPQVHIATRIVMVERGKDRRIGIRWTPDPNSIDPSELENAVLGLVQLGFLDTFGGSSGAPIDAFTRTANGGVARDLSTTTNAGNSILGVDVNLALLLQLLLKNSQSKIIAEPKLVVSNNERGNIFVGSRFPFITDSQTTDIGSVTFGIEYDKVGINLDITPHINPKGDVVLKIELENSQIREGELVNGQIIEDLTEFTTELAIEDGQTMVIGGIILDERNEIKRAVPVLSRIPVVNWFFKKRDLSRSVRELAVFITVEVLKDREDDDALLERARDSIRKLEEMDDPLNTAMAEDSQ